jgi:hypothetical protein
MGELSFLIIKIWPATDDDAHHGGLCVQNRGAAPASALVVQATYPKRCQDLGWVARVPEGA